MATLIVLLSTWVTVTAVIKGRLGVATVWLSIFFVAITWSLASPAHARPAAEFEYLDEFSDQFTAEELAALYDTPAGRAWDRALTLAAWESRPKYMESPEHPGTPVLRISEEKTPEFIKALYERRTPPDTSLFADLY